MSLRTMCAVISSVLIGLVAVLLPAPAGRADTSEQTRLPEFGGASKPMPESVPLRIRGTWQEQYRTDVERGDGTDFFVDRTLARTGADPSGDWLLTRGRAAFMRTHDPRVIGFGGDFAYWDTLGVAGYSITLGTVALPEVVAERVQTPSSFRSRYRGGGLDVVVRKYITDENVAVTDLTVANTGTAAVDLPISVSSPLTMTTDGAELVGRRSVKNDLTLIRPRLSGDGLTPSEGKLQGRLSLASGAAKRFKVQLGLLADELPNSARQYSEVRAAQPQQAWTTHVRAYNQWWADNLPWIDIPDANIAKTLIYRWWLLRYNLLDANIPGNDFQFPTAIEGVLGYNNAIALTVPMFVDDLKYLRDPSLAYGTWLSQGEVSGNGRYVDNPGDPENWSNSYTQYTSESAWQSLQVHGGPKDLMKNLARYAEGDVKDQLKFYDSNNNGLIEYDWGALTGNDADAVSFDWQPDFAKPTRPVMDRAESAYVYSNALAGAAAYERLGNKAKAAELRAVADRVKAGVLNVLWNKEKKLLEHRRVNEGAPLVPWKEINNYYPYAVGLMPNSAEYREALRLWADPEQYPIFPFFTANQADKKEAADLGHVGSNNFSVINSTVSFRFLGRALRDYPSKHITPQMYRALFYWNAWSHYVEGDNRWPDQNEFWANWNAETKQIDYRSWIHHTMLGATNWTMIEDVAGLQPRSDNVISLNPIDIGWKSFAVTDVRYRGSDLAVVWNPGQRGPGRQLVYPDLPEGYSLFLDGKRVATVNRLAPFTYDPATGKVTAEGARVVAGVPSTLAAMDQVDLSATRVPELARYAGRDTTMTTPNLALGSTATASHSATQTTPAAAIDDSTALRPTWGTAGSRQPSDWLQLTFDQPRRINDLRVYFADDRRPGGVAAPAQYVVQYRDGTQWRPVSGASPSPTYPRANENQLRFNAVTTDAVRLVVTPQSSHSVAVKELQLFENGQPHNPAVNAAPRVEARVDPTYNRGGQARLLGEVVDDGLPSGTLTHRWESVSGPGTVTFDAPGAATTIARFSVPGEYRVRLTASDGAKETSVELAVKAEAVDERANIAPNAKVTASYTSPWEKLAAVNDGVEPTKSNADPGQRWGTWPQQGEQWVEYAFERPVRVSSTDAYFFDDVGGVRVPSAWKLQASTSNGWRDVATGSQAKVDQWNKLTFDATVSDRFRLVLTGTTAAVGLVEWRLLADQATPARAVHVPTTVGVQPQLPSTVELPGVYADGGAIKVAVKWPAIDPAQLTPGDRSFAIVGAALGQPFDVAGTVWVRSNPAVQITSIAEDVVQTRVGIPPGLPSTVIATYNDGSKDSRVTVDWADLDESQYAQPGTFTISGTVAGTTRPATARITVVP